MTVRPLLSAVVTTFNRCLLLRKVLLSLACQTLSSDDYEIIIVDDGSTDETKKVVSELEGIFPYRYTFQANSGLASAKNHGLFHARGDIVLFLDDDDIAEPSFLAQHLLAHKEYAALNQAVLGYTSLAENLQNDPLMNFVTGKGRHLFSYESIPGKQYLDYSYFWGGRTSCKRKYLLSHGVFNPIFKFGFEDIELGYRLNSHGLQVIYWPEAANCMIRGMTLDRFLQRCYLQGKSAKRFIDFYPTDTQLAVRLNNLDQADDEWRLIRDDLNKILESAADLDFICRKLDPNTSSEQAHYLDVLHFCYNRAFRAELIRGYVTPD